MRPVVRVFVSLALLVIFSESCSDFVFVLDGSASVQNEFKRIMQIAKDLASELKIDPAGHRAAVLEYSSVAKLRKWPRYTFDHISSAPALQEVITRLRQVQGSTDTGAAFGVVLDEFVSQRRNGVPLVIFTISDGYHRDEETARRNVARLSALPNAHLFAASASSSTSLQGLTTLANGNRSRVVVGNDVVQRAKLLLRPFTACRIKRTEVRRKPENEAIPTTRKWKQTTIGTTKKTTLAVRRTTTTTRRTTTTTRRTTPTTVPTTTTIRTTTTKPYTGKPGCQVDIVLLMDFSGGALDKRDTYVQLASSLVRSVRLGPFDVQVSMIRYSGPGRTDTVFHLGKFWDAEAMVSEMERAPHLGGTTRTGEAIAFAMNEFNPRNGARDNAKKLILLFTDGYSQEDPTEAAESARRSGIEMNAVAVEDEDVPPDTDQLVAIAGKTGVFMSSTFDKLRSQIVDRLRQCK